MAGIGTDIRIEQTQTMKINPAQLQKIEILQMTQLELEEKIRVELMENPVLEIAEAGREERDGYQEAEEYEGMHGNDDLPYDSYDDHDYWDAHGTQAAGTDGDEGIAAFERFYRTEETLGEYLLKQLGSTGLPDAVRRAAGYIIYSLNADGYLDTGLDEIAGLASCTAEEAESALAAVQSLDPAGAGARSVEECLCLQLDPEDELYEDAGRVIRDYLRDIAFGNIKAITSSLGIDAARLVRIIELIRTLDPKPGQRFSDNMPVQYMEPDVYAETSEGEIQVHLAGAQPQLCLSSYYTSLVKNSSDAAVTDYLKERISSASRLIQNIEQRNRTLLNVTKAVMQHQISFIELGPKALSPLTMQEIADELGINVSTVSRAVSGKHIHCGGGTYALRQFFTSEVSGMARDSVLERIKELIAGEDPAHPLSDQKIADMLSAEDIEISRRTVAKYRDSAGILSTSMRRKR